MKLIDTHTHLYVEAFDKDREEIIQKAIPREGFQTAFPARE